MTDDQTRESPEALAEGASAPQPASQPGEQTETNGNHTGETTAAVRETKSGTEPEGERFERRWSKRAQSTQPPREVSPAGDSDLAGQLEKEKARADELFERLQRSMADLSNYRKRSESEREDVTKFANMLLVSELLPVLDNFERALSAIPKELEHFTWLQGIALIERHLQALLEREGLQAIEAAGTPFNPSFHEAIVEEEAADVAPGTVIGEMQRGYTMHGRVIRPTLAKVAKAPISPGEAGSESASQETTSSGQPEHIESDEEDGQKSDGS